LVLLSRFNHAANLAALVAVRNPTATKLRGQSSPRTCALPRLAGIKHPWGRHHWRAAPLAGRPTAAGQWRPEMSAQRLL